MATKSAKLSSSSGSCQSRESLPGEDDDEDAAARPAATAEVAADDAMASLP